ncbi:pre-peptidase C-terminal domain-containing protein [Neorhodopirellula lusitana]|uniref:pre-peptidase C-terminal domain-containing protein n=1 Tax=Neorhodopirellula lusitana TaxID=445327 RepID=UPI003850D2C3
MNLQLVRDRMRNHIFVQSALSLMLAISMAGPALAAFPQVLYHHPLGATRGGEATVVLKGSRLGDARQILFDDPGIEVLELKPTDEKSVELKIKTEKDLAPGRYPFRLVTASGVSNLRFLSIGTMPMVMEKEPNNQFDAPQPIPMDCTIEGNVDREDIDYFQVELKAGQRLTVEVEGLRHRWVLNNRDILDPHIAILNEKRFEVASCDDSPLFQQDGVCSFTPEEAGKYVVAIRDSSFGGQKNVCGYRLHVGSFPRPTTIVPAAGMQGDVLNASMIDVDGSVRDVSLQLPTGLIDSDSTGDQGTREWSVISEDDHGVSPTPNWIRVGNLPIVHEVEPNNNHRDAPKCEIPAVLCGVLGEANDFDCFSFECKKGKAYRVQLYARETLRSPLDGVVNVFGPDGKTIKSADDVGGSPDGFLTFSAGVDGFHTVRVYDHLRTGGPLHNYSIEVTHQVPNFKLDLKELRRDEAAIVPVPIGGHGAMVLRATRDGFNEEIEFEIEGLPEGVTAQTFPMPKGRVEIPVVFSASADAKLNGALFDVTGRGKLRDREVTGNLQQNHKIVLGQNRRAMLQHLTDRAAVAVCEAMPFDVELVQPKTPILRRGDKELLVKIQRHEGFDSTVSIKTLYTPPGIAVNNSRKIEKGKTEVIVPVTANANAALGAWPIVMQISYATKRGAATVTTAPIMLDVEMPVFNFSFPRTAAETGTEISLTVGVEKQRDIEGDLEIELVGLPNGVTSPEPIQKATLSDTAVTFPLVIDAKAKTGTHKTLVVRTRVTRDGESFMQTDGQGELRIDKPLPKKEPKAKEKKAEKKPVAKPKAKAAPKPLSRLEQLRQQKEAS